MPSPFFSVIVATWNRAAILPRALDSVTGQTLGDWECLVVDDGSEDDTAAVVSRYLADARFHYFRQPHAGISAARNNGLAAATGEWITFLDSDDAYAPEHLARRREFLKAHPEMDFVHGGCRVIGPPEAHHVPDARDPARLIPISECVVGATIVARADLLRRLGGFPDVAYGMDYELAGRAAAQTVVGLCSDPTYLYHRELGQGVCEEMRRITRRV